jgi:hypothetical protein
MTDINRKVLSSEDLRIIPINAVIQQIYDLIVSSAKNGQLFVDVSFGSYLRRKSEHLATEQNQEFVRDEISKLFPGIQFIAQGTATLYYDSASYTYSVWKATWAEEQDDIA